MPSPFQTPGLERGRGNFGNFEFDLEAARFELPMIRISCTESTSGEERAFALYLRGKLLNIGNKYNQDAEVALCKSVKLDPARFDAWNCLGSCFYKNSRVEMARACFQESIQQVPMLS